MTIMPRNMTLLTLLTLLCLHFLAASVSGAEVLPVPNAEESVIKKQPAGKRSEKQREAGAAKFKRPESRSSGGDISKQDVRPKNERQQRMENGQRGSQRPNFGRSRETARETMSPQRKPTFLAQRESLATGQQGVAPPAELMQLNPQEKTRTQERSRKDAGKTRDRERRPESRVQSGFPATGVAPPAELMQLNPQEKTRTQERSRDGRTGPRQTNHDTNRPSGGAERYKDSDRKGDRKDDYRREYRPDDRRPKSGSRDDDRREYRSDDHRVKSRSGDDYHRQYRSDDHRAKNRSGDDYRREYPSWDDNRKYQSGPRHSDRDRHRSRVVKHVVHHIPPRHAVILHGRDNYHYYSGRFYRPWNTGFILVRPPLGLVVLNIPIGHHVVVSAGISYFVFGDVYYRRVPMGYQVVEPIRVPASNWPDQVSVVIDVLNVRYGPDTNEEVIAQVNRYSVLRVLGSAPGWLYVEVEGEENIRGWVMEQYVSSDLGRG